MLSAAILVTCFNSTTPETGYAQVNMKDRPVTLAADDQRNHSIARPAQPGYNVIVWEDYRNGVSDIYAQRIDNTNGIPQWYPFDGVPVCTYSGAQRNPRAVLDSLGGVIVTWEDFRTDTAQQFNPETALCEVYTQRLLLTTGRADPNWGGPVRVCGNLQSRAVRPRIVGKGDGAYIAWTDYRNSSGTPVRNLDVYAQSVQSADGSVNWTANGLNVVAQTGANNRNPELVLDSLPNVNGAHGAVIVFEGKPGRAWQLYATRMDSSGMRLWSGLSVATVQNPSVQDNHQLNHRIVPLVSDSAAGHRGVLVVWQDERDRGTTKTDIYAQRLDIEYTGGRALWPSPATASGLAVCTYTDEQHYPVVDAYGTRALLAWTDYRAGNWDIYASRVNVNTGTVAVSQGSMICGADSAQMHVEVECAMDRQSLVWEDYRAVDEGRANIYLQELDPGSGSALWPGNGQLVTAATTNQYLPQIGQRVIVYTDDRRDPLSADSLDDANIYAQTVGDECDLPTNMHWTAVLPKWTPGTTATDHRMVTDKEGNMYITWYEDRTVSQHAIHQAGVYAQKLDRRGVPRWTNNGVLLSDTNNTSGKPDICINGSGGAIVAWHEENGGLYDIRVTNLDAYGNTEWSTSLNAGSYDLLNPRITDDENGGVYVVYEEEGNDLLYTSIDNAGNTTSPSGSIGWPAYDARIVKDNLGGFYYIGRGFFFTEWFIQCSHIHPSLSPAYSDFFRWQGAFQGYDLAIDNVLNAVYQWNDAIVVYSKNTIIASKLSRNPSSQTLKDETSLVSPLGIAGMYCSLPSVDADSVPGTFGGGAIIAYDISETDSATGIPKHGVQTNRVIWVADTVGGRLLVSVGVTWLAPVQLSGLPLATGCDDPTYPVITRRPKREPYTNTANTDAVFGVVAWQDDGYSQCADVGIVAMELDYALPNAYPHQPMQWSAIRDVSPSPGAEQTRAILRAGAGDSLCLLWLDTRLDDVALASTAIGKSNDIVWVKHGVTEEHPVTESVTLDQTYPNPFRASQGATLAYTLAEAGTMELSVYDLLGRKISVIDAGTKQKGRHYAALPAGLLAPGVYLYTLVADGRLSTRAMIVVR